MPIRARLAAPLLLLTSALAFGQGLPGDLDATIARAMRTFEVPGAAIAVVKDGKILLAKGYGVRNLGRPDPVDENTLFGIASNTKLFTATALGLLVDEGKLEWDAPVQKYMPDFALRDPYVSRELTVRDLLVHRSGLTLGAGDLLWWPPSTYTPAQVMSRLRNLPLEGGFRSRYAYDNVLYIVAGQLIERVSGKKWGAFVQDRILGPLGMSHSRPSYAEALKVGNLSGTHAKVEGKLGSVPSISTESMDPAGGVMASASDMALWLRTQLDHGVAPDGKRLFSADTSRQLWSPVTPMPISADNLSPALESVRPHFKLYAMGLVASDYRGKYQLQHNGWIPGYTSLVTLLPEERLGIVVLSNQESFAFWTAITNGLLDQFLGAPKVDWVAEFSALEKKGAEAVADESPAKTRKHGTSPHLAPAEYAGTYTDPWYGDVNITQEAGKLVIRFSHTPALVGDLEHWQYDTFLVKWRDRTLRADAFITFDMDHTGVIMGARMAPYDASVDFSYDFQDLSLKRVRR